jgi:hypothetical protein
VRTGREANVSVPFIEQFSAKDREQAEKAIERLESKQRKAAESRGDKAGEIIETFHGRLRDLLGAKKSAALAEALQRERLGFRDLFEPPEGLRRSYAKEHQASRRRIANIVKKLGVNPATVSRIVKQADEELGGVLTVHEKVTPGFSLPKHYEKWVDLSPYHKFPLPWTVGWPVIDPDDPHRWFLFQPPFFGFLFSFTPQTTSNFVVDRELILAPAVGEVGNVASMHCTDAGDFDLATVTCESQIAFGFVPPITGIVEVLIDAVSTFDRHQLQISDEFGFSDASCSQTSFLMMNVLHPNVAAPSLAQMAGVSEETEGDSFFFDESLLTRGRHFFAHLFSAGAVPAGQSVVVTAGARTFDQGRANDMELHGRSHCQWFINSVEVRIAP